MAQDEKMTHRAALVTELLAVESISKTQLCQRLFGGHLRLREFQEWERGDSNTLNVKLVQYIAGLHPDSLSKLPSLHHVYPTMVIRHKQTDWDKISPHCKSSHYRLTEETKAWILQHVIRLPSEMPTCSVECVHWVSTKRCFVLVTCGDKPIEKECQLVTAMLQCRKSLGRATTHLFFLPSTSYIPQSLSSRQIQNALHVLGFADMLIVIGEFHNRGIASIVKEMQDFHASSTHPFGMLLYSSDRTMFQEVATEVFYSVHEVNVIRDLVPTPFMEPIQKEEEPSHKLKN